MVKSFRQLRGVALMMVLMLMVFVVMFAAAVANLAIQQQHSSSSFYYGQAALISADAGINYAMSRLSAERDWIGCKNHSENLHYSVPEAGFEVYEHFISGTGGCVEGKLSLGNSSGYFDIYFTPPPGGGVQRFFGSEKDGGLPPSRIILSSNNIAIGVSGNVYNSDDPVTPLPKRMVPARSALLVCRGTFGHVSRTVEIAFRITPDLNNTVMWARNDVDIAIRGMNAYDRLVLGRYGEDSPSVMRSGSLMNIGMHPSIYLARSSRNYLEVIGGSTGESNVVPTWKNNILPENGSEQFKRVPGQDQNMPSMSMEAVKKEIESGGNLSNAFQLTAGTYLVERDPSNPNRPRVTYFRTNSEKLKDLTGASEDVTGQFAGYLGTEMSWDYNAGKLTLLKSCQVKISSDLENLNFIAPLNKSVSVQLGPDAKEGNSNPSVYLVNERGGIFIDGQVTGVGTIISGGNLTMQPESRLTANDANGLTIFCGGSVTINQIKNSPIQTAQKTIYDKIMDFIYTHRSDKEYILFDTDINYDTSKENMELAFCVEFAEMLDAIGIRDGYYVPESIFTAEEKAFIEQTLYPNPRIDPPQSSPFYNGFFTS